MAAAAGKLSRQTLLKAKSVTNLQQAQLSFKSIPKGKKRAYGLLGAVALGGLGAVGAALGAPVLASELVHEAPRHGWAHAGMFRTLDMASVRRGWEVYKQVCSACHSLEFICYRHFVGAFMTEEEAKREAKEAMVRDGPNEEGEMFERPGKLPDRIPAPYLNDEASKAANNGALPPDLSFIVAAREGDEDYVFSLLTSYMDAPPGLELPENTHYNPYFVGGAIAMAEPLYNEIIEYTDGTPATKSQLAKDVATFLLWTSDPDHDYRKKLGIKAIGLFTIFTLVFFYAKRHQHMSIKGRKIALRTRR